MEDHFETARQGREVTRKKHHSIRAEEAYVEWIKRFIIFHGKCFPKDLKEHEISQSISDHTLARKYPRAAKGWG